MAGDAAQVFVGTYQAEVGVSIMVEVGLVPGFCDMALLALGAKLPGMCVVNLVAGGALCGGVEVACVPMALVARH